MDELRKLQKVGYNTLSVSIPRDFVKALGLRAGDSLLVREDADGTLRLIPARNAKSISRVVIRAEQAGSDDMLAKLIVGAYALGYDAIEVEGKRAFSSSTSDSILNTVKRLKGLEVVETTPARIVVQSFTDPTKFPVDSLIKRLQILVSRSLDNVLRAVDLKRTGSLNEVQRAREEVDELYWLIVRQLLVALNRREMALEIGLESPLHASGDRVTAKTLDEIGEIILDVSEELIRLKGRGVMMDAKIAGGIRRLGALTQQTFNTTVEGLLTQDLKLIAKSTELVERTLDLEREITHELLESRRYSYARLLVSQFGQIARYCNIIVEVAANRLLRKTSRVATVQQK